MGCSDGILLKRIGELFAAAKECQCILRRSILFHGVASVYTYYPVELVGSLGIPEEINCFT